MLKSHFNLVYDDAEPKAEEEHEPEATVDEEEKEVIPDRLLNKPEISVRLSMLGKNAEGDGYTYLKATLTGLKLTDIKTVTYFTNLMFLDVSDNHLDNKALQVVCDLPYLILLQADKNRLTSAALKKMRFLQVIIMNHNQITSLHDIIQDQLSTVEIGYNKIHKVNFPHKMNNLKVIDFRYNEITDIADFDFPNLDSLYLAGNKITSLVGLEKLPKLRVLHVRNNPIKLLDGFDEVHTKLSYINLRNCKVATLRQVKKLRVLRALETLNMKGCPYMGGPGDEDAENADDEEDPETRIETLAALPRLKRINKDTVSPEEREDAKDLMTQWIEDGEKDEEEIEDEQNEEEEKEQ